MSDIWRRWSGLVKLACGCKREIDETVDWEDWREPGHETSCGVHGATEVVSAARHNR